MTGKEISGSICQSIYHWGGSIYQCGQITPANFDENLSGSKCQLGSMILESNRRTKEKKDETNRDRRS